MKNKVCLIIFLAILLIGIGLIAYPSFSDFINRQFAYQTITEYRDVVGQKDIEEMKAEIERAQNYNRILAKQQNETGLGIPSAEGISEMSEEGKMLGYIEIESLDIYCPIYFGISEEVMNKGIGVAEYSSLPVGGESTHSVLVGHSGLPSKKLFTDIDQLKEGDVIFIHVLNQSLAYQVEQLEVVLPSDAEQLKIQEGEDEITLLTCTPYGINTHRLLVQAKRIPYDFTTEKASLMQQQKEDWLWVYVALGCVGTGIVCAIFVKRKKKKGGNQKRSKKKTIQKYAGILLGLCCLFFLFPLNINEKGKAEIEVIEKNPVTGEKLPGIELSLYKIAEFLNGDYSLPIYEKVFAGLGEDITKLMKEHTNQETAAFLEENIKNSHMKEYEKKTTGEDGRVVFSELEEGIYLLRCTGNENVSYEIEQASVLIQIPMREEQGIQIWNVKLEPKNDVRYPDEQQEMSVVKIWKDNNNKAGKRPEKILVGLYEDNELKEQVELSSKNNWSYEWKQLNKDAVYRVTELQIPEEYEMSVENTENTYTITNTYTKRTEEPHKRKDVKTGDKAEMGVWMLVMLLSLIVICYLHKRENRNGI